MAALSERAVSQNLPFLDLDHYRPERQAVGLIPYEVAHRFRLLPLFQDDDRLAVAVVELDLAALDYVGRLTNLDVEPVLVEASALCDALRHHYVAEGHSGLEWGKLASQALERTRPEAQRTLSERSDSPVARLFEHLVSQAVQLRASDLHLEIAQGIPRLRYRIDGVLNDFEAPPADVYPALVSRIKILAHLDIAEKRRPQDGRITFPLENDGLNLELRISIIPYLDGEGVVVRLLGSGGGVISLDELGFGPEMLTRYRLLLRRSHGLILVTGPTGAGKTTTLYASLADISSPKRKILTLEDPVEYRLPGICQIPVRPEVEFSFAEGLRAVLRHDPDVLMLGEIRDLESAEIAVRASLTGHLIFATLHTNSASQAVTRLVDIGVAPYKVNTSLLGVVAQRLLRRLCPHCKRPTEHLDSVVYVAVGCDKCGGLGYRGRLPVYEFLEMGEAPSQHFVPMRTRALEMLMLGETSLAEVEGFMDA